MSVRFAVRLIAASSLISACAVTFALAERLDKRFGDDGERGYRSEREFEGRDSGFRNRDRANFLGAKAQDRSQPETPKLDLQAPATIGLQR